MAQEQIRQFIDQATQSIQSGQFDQALQLIEQALALDPNNAEAYVLKGIGLSQTGQPAAATEALKRAVDLDPNNAKAEYNLAVHLYSQGLKTEALNAARQASVLDASHAAARQLVSTIETELGIGARPTTPFSNDPIAEAPPTNVAPPPMEQPGPTPFAQASQPQYVNPYMKDPYASQEHSIPFIGNMGGAWTAIGWFLAALNLVGGLILVYMVIQTMPHVNPNNPDEAQQFILRTFGGLVNLVRICGFGGMFGIIAWTIIDVIDRRSNPVWLIPGVVCSCCQFGWLALPIYILAGRNK